MEAFFVSAGVVALGEMGDKTQLLAMMLAVKFRRPVPILLGILVATLLNHATAGLVGEWIARALGPVWLRWVIGLWFLAMAAWALLPDRDDGAAQASSRFGVFGTTLVGYFLAEMGDKTQIATVALAAHYQDLVQVVGGTTLGIVLADAPAVFIGERLATRISVRWMHRIAAGIFALLGILTLANAGHFF